jgi:hypothetical protein
MIHVEITMWPGGDEDKAYNLGTMLIANDGLSDEPDFGNYGAVLSKRGGKGLWKEAKVTSFPRKRLGPYDLLYRILKVAVGSRNE